MGNQITKNEMEGASSAFGDRRGAYMVLVRRYEGKKPLGILMRRWENNIKMDLQKWNG
jgi:hypothetical protein